jgi:hypothetical protein
MNAPGRVDVVTSGSMIAEQFPEDGAGSLQYSNHTSIPVRESSAPIPEQSPQNNFANAPNLQESVTTDAGNENQSQILKSNSDSDESNESGSLPSKSSSTIDSSGSLGKDDRVADKSGTRPKSSKRKKDRSKLRKGKWTVSNFSSGLSHAIDASLT